MQFSHALIALVAAGLANAQLPDVPSCSVRIYPMDITIIRQLIYHPARLLCFGLD